MKMRSCGECTLCCKLLPMSRNGNGSDVAERLVRGGLAAASDFAGMLRDFDKPAGARCPFQKHHKGCTQYRRRPFGCRMWSCRWLTNDDTAELQRPDRSHYVVDESPDFVSTNEGNTAVIQIWCDPSFPAAHRDPALRAYLARRWAEGFAALVRYDASSAIVLYMEGGEWKERDTNMRTEGEHSAAEKHAVGLSVNKIDALNRLNWALGKESKREEI